MAARVLTHEDLQLLIAYEDGIERGLTSPAASPVERTTRHYVDDSLNHVYQRGRRVGELIARQIGREVARRRLG